MTAISDARGLLNQWAKEPSGRIIHATECSGGVDYACPMPDCQQRLSVVAEQSESVRAHLRHMRECTSGESAEHYTAKSVAASLIRDWVAGRADHPIVWHPCSSCSRPSSPRPLFMGSVDACAEFQIGNRRADVAAVDRSGRPLIAIEILVTHAVDGGKAEDFRAAGVPWVELRASDVLSRSRWVAVASSIKRRMCPDCTSASANELFDIANAERERAVAKVAESERLTLVATEADRRAASCKTRLEAAEREIARLSPIVSGSEERVRSLRARVESDISTVFAPVDAWAAGRVLPTWTLPPARFVELERLARRQEGARVEQYGAHCPRCGTQKVIPRKAWGDQLFCVGCGHAFIRAEGVS